MFGLFFTRKRWAKLKARLADIGGRLDLLAEKVDAIGAGAKALDEGLGARLSEQTATLGAIQQELERAHRELERRSEALSLRLSEIDLRLSQRLEALSASHGESAKYAEAALRHTTKIVIEKIDEQDKNNEKITQNILDSIQQNVQRISNIEEHINWREKIFYKAFAMAGIWDGDYVEFGVYTGGTLSQAYWCARRQYDFVMQGGWDHSVPDSAEYRAAVRAGFGRMRFIGFDSFAGMPQAGSIDKIVDQFTQGTYSNDKANVLARLEREDVPLDRVRLVEGFFADVCVAKTAAELVLERISVLHIDSDLYESAKIALDFCGPYLRDGTIVIFDDWFMFNGRADLGEQRAFREWLDANPSWHAAEFAREGAGRVAFILNRPSNTTEAVAVPSERGTGVPASGAN